MLIFVSILILILLDTSSSHDDFVTISDEEYAISEPGNSYPDAIFKTQKRPAGNEIKSKVIEAMLNTPMYHLDRSQPDIFDAFADQYDLPKGMYFDNIFLTVYSRPIHTCYKRGESAHLYFNIFSTNSKRSEYLYAYKNKMLQK